ncbi:uncharacterized protein LOC119074617 [Bradysia coprophila]|uniref:uncharacterized protein LOC119074617 n=1 Tax=Bradysia coprophila TaxID=38358 RepID=UPI00187D8A10|nr:uncharacterized protein LOC119074617 [Bradysia coprophila]
MALINNLADTPNKRKRRESKYDDSVDYYSNPNRLLANKENNYMGMEVKSIAQMIADKTIENPFEVIRKPPKKKKKSDIEDSCFVNPALNINGPETVLNPFEVIRQPTVVKDDLCFINSGLNIRIPDKACPAGNAYEISRSGNGIENPALDLKQSTPRAIAVPFTPNMGCRINFSDIPLESLTPCSLLTKKLVLESPKLPLTPKRSMKASVELSAISEELNIGEELDCYQLELENSINEAKVDKNKQTNDKNLMDLKHKTTFARRLELSEQQYELEKESVTADVTPIPEDLPKTVPIECENRDVVFEEVNETSDDEFEFKNPAPFVRTYRRSTRKPSNASVKSNEKTSNEPKEKSSGFRNSIRQSIRKLIAPNSVKATSQPTPSLDEPSGSVFTTLRQSFRRKAASSKTSLIDDNQGSLHDVSVLMDVDRKVYKQTAQEMTSDDALNSFGRKKSLRSSFRDTTKDVRRHVMKSVFKKNVEDYRF